MNLKLTAKSVAVNMRTEQKHKLAQLRHWRIRKKVSGTKERPRMSVCFTNENIYVQFIDDIAGVTLAAASTTSKATPDRENSAANVASAKTIGTLAAQAAIDKGIKAGRVRPRWRALSRQSQGAGGCRARSRTAILTYKEKEILWLKEPNTEDRRQAGEQPQPTRGTQRRGNLRSATWSADAAVVAVAARTSRRTKPAFDGQGGEELIEKVVFINRSAKVVKGGRRFNFSALVVVGDKKGRSASVSAKPAKSRMPFAKAANWRARKWSVFRLKDATIPHEVFSHYGGAKVLLRPASPGTGIIAGKTVRAVLESAGVKDILSKSLGSKNAANVVKATLAGAC